MIVIYYRNKDGEIDSFHEFEGTIDAANLYVAEHNAKWSIQTARAVHIPDGSFLEYLYILAVEHLSMLPSINRALDAIHNAQLALELMEAGA